ncbi:hypothetical protein [Vibrio lentus]|uniref:hypothetical protein n=1 Tax=Vibrio lentus TaxID=136468 RepID=UPI0009783950|nr:hypothetical protein [Vibrio lentus]OMO21242.1 hypothetical protein BH583_10890 [Vibrio lentus]PMN15154.1 hypothetical protein BCT38_00410 [Vibrio lentus]
MAQILPDFIASLNALQKALLTDDVSPDTFIDTYGWDHSALDKFDLSSYIRLFVEKISVLDESNLNEEFLSSIQQYTLQIDSLKKYVLEHYIEDDVSLRTMVTNIVMTLHVIFSTIDNKQFSWSKLEDNKYLPRNLSNRLKSSSLRIQSIETSSEDLELKIKVINEAHAAAESLPTDLKELRDTRDEIKSILEQVKKQHDDILGLVSDSEKASDEIFLLKIKAFNNKEKTDTYVEECDEALQITTTEGLAAGFDQKAKQLNRSIWIWIIGLLAALVSGAYLGYIRVEDLTKALTSELSTGQAVLHTIMSIFSIGGPLWLAWISTQQIMQRFKLAEDYAYKATVAKSYIGFSKHASRFDEATSERLFNSTLDRLDEMPLRLVENKDYNSPWHEFIDSQAFKTALTMVPELAATASRFASNTKMKSKPKKPDVRPTPQASPEKNQDSNSNEEAA